MTGRNRMMTLSRHGIFGLLLMLAGLVFLAAAAAAPFMWRQSMQASLEDEARLMQLIESKLKAADSARKPSTVTAENADRAFVAGATAGLATANLQRIMSDLAASNGMQVEKVQPLPAEEKNGLAALRLEIETTGTIESLRGFLHAIETGTPLIFVKEAHVASDNNASKDMAQLPAEKLTVSLQVESYSWWGTKP